MVSPLLQRHFLFFPSSLTLSGEVFPVALPHLHCPHCCRTQCQVSRESRGASACPFISSSSSISFLTLTLDIPHSAALRTLLCNVALFLCVQPRSSLSVLLALHTCIPPRRLYLCFPLSFTQQLCSSLPPSLSDYGYLSPVSSSEISRAKLCLSLSGLFFFLF